MIRLNETPIEINGKKWVFYGGIYKFGSLDGSVGIVAKNTSSTNGIMITENLVKYGRPTVGGYIALAPVLEAKKYLGLKKVVKEMFCEGDESILSMLNDYRVLIKLKPKFEKMIREDDLKE